MNMITEYDVYVRLDTHNAITKIFSSVFAVPKDTDVLIDIGSGDKYHHCQNCYLEDTTYDSNYLPNFKYLEGSNSIVRLTDDEKLAWYPKKEEVPTEMDILKERQDLTEAALQELILTTMGGK